MIDDRFLMASLYGMFLWHRSIYYGLISSSSTGLSMARKKGCWIVALKSYGHTKDPKWGHCTPPPPAPLEERRRCSRSDRNGMMALLSPFQVVHREKQHFRLGAYKSAACADRSSWYTKRATTTGDGLTGDGPRRQASARGKIMHFAFSRRRSFFYSFLWIRFSSFFFFFSRFLSEEQFPVQEKEKTKKLLNNPRLPSV